MALIINDVLAIFIGFVWRNVIGSDRGYPLERKAMKSARISWLCGWTLDSRKLCGSTCFPIFIAVGMYVPHTSKGLGNYEHHPQPPSHCSFSMVAIIPSGWRIPRVYVKVSLLLLQTIMFVCWDVFFTGLSKHRGHGLIKYHQTLIQANF